MIAAINHHGDTYTAYVESIQEYGVGDSEEAALDDLADSIRELNDLLRNEQLGPAMIKIQRALEQESIYTWTELKGH